ncbi:CPBP family intramembrane glutamic endopeptidase [Tessaracoccus sp. OH4464_COT-324]|uniref:CPBP family intramembrane glutamic endopeptidase n=1 Tax=Tessaracoccus sp. OH4464_COT-324 TaxID=2491059 RepID=UPI000F6327F0|nr:type II CAAX endopeptidase family protein [Tessaracoccus sp. OH4464_COT-324]RRD47507.1 CPBP family intramembrane metalloprotease [Tessaracoccus sp. OH4464_COT-324]
MMVVLLHRGAPTKPDPEQPYPLSLRPLTLVEGTFGLLLAASGFVLVLPLVSNLVLRLFFWFRGRSDFDAYLHLARAYHLPEGLLAGHLALASLTLVVLGITRAVHGRLARWIFSVQPGMRWRYLLAVFVLAAVVLHGMLWISFSWQGVPVFNSGQPGARWFIVAVLLASPLQALAEEVFFRGYLLAVMGSVSGRIWVGIVGSSVVFALLHGVQNPALFTHRLVFGLIAGTMVYITGGLEAGIAAHIVNNLGAFGYAIFTTSVAEARAVTEIGWGKAGWDILAFALYALLAWLIARRMRLATVSPPLRRG